MSKSKKEIFIDEITSMIESVRKTTGENPLSEEAMDYLNALSVVEEKATKKFTDNGKIIIQYMKDNCDSYSNMFKAKDFENAGVSSKTASGALRKLVADGYADKMGQSPVVYSLTAAGKEVDINEE